MRKCYNCGKGTIVVHIDQANGNLELPHKTNVCGCCGMNLDTFYGFMNMEKARLLLRDAVLSGDFDGDDLVRLRDISNALEDLSLEMREG